jgi:hypothetical protein
VEQKKIYQSPCVLKTLPLEMESNLLAGSVVTKDTGVKSTGQEVTTYDFSGTQFNQEWE